MTTYPSVELLAQPGAHTLEQPLDVEATVAPSTAAPAPAPDVERRTITGALAVWDEPGIASIGPCLFLAGSIALPYDLRRVKLLLDHDPSRPVGYLVSASTTAKGIVGTFHVPEGDVGDLALAHARDGLRDALSVGTHVTDYGFDQQQRVVVKAAQLNEVSLVAIPAFANARVSDVKAAQHPTTGESMKRKRTIPAAEGAATVATGSSPAPEGAPVTVEAQQAPQQPPAAAPAAPEQPAAAPTGLALEASHVQAVVEAVREATQQRAAASSVVPLDLRATAGLVVDHLRRGGAAAALPMVLEAALNDVTPANLTTTDYGPRRPQYVDDLWQLADVARPTVDAFGPPKPLTSLKAHGFVWDVRPEVARYDGNKANVPTNAPKKRRIETTAQRFAGGWDIDRVFIDLPNGTDEVADVLTEATRSYKEQSEAYVAEVLRAAATLMYGAAVSVPGALATIGSYFAKVTGARIGYIALGETAWDDFANMGKADVPWWLEKLGTLSLGEGEGEAGGLRFRLDPTLEPTQVLAADRRAAQVREVDPPVRVQALDIPRGGVDVGVFGYIAAWATEPRLIVNLDTAGRTEPAP